MSNHNDSIHVRFGNPYTKPKSESLVSRKWVPVRIIKIKNNRKEIWRASITESTANAPGAETYVLSLLIHHEELFEKIEDAEC